jgi:transcriptional regulator with PAS, ATPase and Fis domain
MARAIHAESPRSHGPFVAVSCAALTETLLESELFGHERGSFTGAVARQRGKFEMANHGTLFLDEIGDITPKLQLDLLRVLEERTFHRVGGTEAVQVDVRIVAATNRDLKKAVANGTFREDLYYRLNVIPISIPPLRDRREDIPLLVDHLLEQLGVEAARTIDGVSHDAMSLLMAHDWPGNVRELRNILERAVVVASGAVIQPGDIGLQRPSERGAEPVGLLSLDEIERRHIAAVLEHTGGNITQAARILDIDRVTLYNKIKKYHLREIESA